MPTWDTRSTVSWSQQPDVVNSALQTFIRLRSHERLRQIGDRCFQSPAALGYGTDFFLRFNSRTWYTDSSQDSWSHGCSVETATLWEFCAARRDHILLTYLLTLNLLITVQRDEQLKRFHHRAFDDDDHHHHYREWGSGIGSFGLLWSRIKTESNQHASCERRVSSSVCNRAWIMSLVAQLCPSVYHEYRELLPLKADYNDAESRKKIDPLWAMPEVRRLRPINSRNRLWCWYGQKQITLCPHRPAFRLTATGSQDVDIM